MRYATSIKLLGELIPAEECDYQSFSNLCLVCPHCKKSVYLVGEHERCATTRQLQTGKIVPVKESRVSRHFTHHISDENSLDCDKKDSDVTAQVLAHRKVVAKNQRAKLFRSSFWQLYCSNQYFKDHFEMLSQFDFDGYVDDAHIGGYLSFYSPLFNDRISINMSAKNLSVKETEKDMLFRDVNEIEYVQIIAKSVWEQSRRTTGFTEQYTFLLEVLTFLYAPPNKKILRRCLIGLVISIYCKSFFETVNHSFPTVSLARLTPITRERIIQATEIASNTLLEEHYTKVDSRLNSVEVSALSMSLIVSLLSIDLDVEFEKYGL